MEKMHFLIIHGSCIRTGNFWTNKLCDRKVWGFSNAWPKISKKHPAQPGSPEEITFPLSKITNSVLLSLNLLLSPHPPTLLHALDCAEKHKQGAEWPFHRGPSPGLQAPFFLISKHHSSNRSFYFLHCTPALPLFLFLFLFVSFFLFLSLPLSTTTFPLAFRHAPVSPT